MKKPYKLQVPSNHLHTSNLHYIVIEFYYVCIRHTDNSGLVSCRIVQLFEEIGVNHADETTISSNSGGVTLKVVKVNSSANFY